LISWEIRQADNGEDGNNELEVEQDWYELRDFKSRSLECVPIFDAANADCNQFKKFNITTIPNFGHAEIKLNCFDRNRAAVPIQLQQRTCSSCFVRPSIPAVPP
jgi:hypothetical protein